MSSANSPNGSLGRSRFSPPQTMTMDPSVHPKETKWIVMASYPRDCFQKTMKNIDVSQSVFLPRTKFGNMCSYPSLCVNTFHPISVMHKNCRSSGGGGNVRVPDTMGLTCDSYTIRFCPAARQDHVKSSVCPSSKNKRKRSVLLSFRCHFVFALVGGTLS